MTSHGIFLTCPEAGQSYQPARLSPSWPVLPCPAKIPKRLPAVNAGWRLPPARIRRLPPGTFAAEPNVVYFWSVRKRDCELWNCRISPDAGEPYEIECNNLYAVVRAGLVFVACYAPCASSAASRCPRASCAAACDRYGRAGYSGCRGGGG